MAYIYIIKNDVNDKMYVGQCMRPVENRFKSHLCCKDNAPLHKAMREIGSEHFYFEIVAECDDLDRLNTETYYIEKFNTLIPNGYNRFKHSSNGFSFNHHNSDSKELQSQKTQLWWKASDEKTVSLRNKKISESLQGKKFSYEHRQKLSEIAKKRVGDKNPFYGKKHSESTKKLISKLNQKMVFEQYDLNGDYIQTFLSPDSVYEYVKQNGLSNGKKSSVLYRIYYTAAGKQKSAYGYKWKSRKCNDYSLMGDEISQ